jgi:hypothetical protein
MLLVKTSQSVCTVVFTLSFKDQQVLLGWDENGSQGLELESQEEFKKQES